MGGWLSPVPGDESPVPAERGRWLHDQQHVGEAPTVEHRGEHRKDRAVGLGELGPAALAVEYHALVSESEDLSITGVAGREEPPKPCEDQSGEGIEQGHGQVDGIDLASNLVFSSSAPFACR